MWVLSSPGCLHPWMMQLSISFIAPLDWFIWGARNFLIFEADHIFSHLAKSGFHFTAAKSCSMLE